MSEGYGFTELPAASGSIADGDARGGNVYKLNLPEPELGVGDKVRVKRTGARGVIFADKLDADRGRLWLVHFAAWPAQYFHGIELARDGEAA